MSEKKFKFFFFGGGGGYGPCGPLDPPLTRSTLELSLLIIECYNYIYIQHQNQYFALIVTDIV